MKPKRESILLKLNFICKWKEKPYLITLNPLHQSIKSKINIFKCIFHNINMNNELVRFYKKYINNKKKKS